MRNAQKVSPWVALPLCLTFAIAGCEPTETDLEDEREDVAEERAEAAGERMAAGADTMEGMAGADTMEGMARANTMEGMAGADAVAEQEIRRLNEEWVAAVEARDTAWIGDLYARRGMLMAPGAPAATGRDSVVGLWGQLIADPNMQLTFSPTEIHVSEGGDMAYDVGTYSMTLSDGVQDSGKYLVVWVREDGRWRVAADMFNSNQPPPGGGGA